MPEGEAIGMRQPAGTAPERRRSQGGWRKSPFALISAFCLQEAIAAPSGALNALPFIDLSALDGSNGFRIDIQNGDEAGTSVRIADFNDDRVDDVMIGGPCRRDRHQRHAARKRLMRCSERPPALRYRWYSPNSTAPTDS